MAVEQEGAVPAPRSASVSELVMEWSGKSHVEVVAEARGAIHRLLQDPLLSDLGPEVTPDEVSSQLALLQGRALTLQLRMYHDQIIPVVVLQGCTVRDVMLAVERDVSSHKYNCKRTGMTSSTVISWSYVWRTYWLAYGQIRLEDDSARLANYGIGNHSELRFVKKLKTKRKQN